MDIGTVKTVGFRDGAMCCTESELSGAARAALRTFAEASGDPDHACWQNEHLPPYVELDAEHVFFPEVRTRVWAYVGGVVAALFAIPLLMVPEVVAAVASRGVTDVWLVLALMVLALNAAFVVWLVRRVRRSLRYHREQDAHPTHGLYLLPETLVHHRGDAPAQPGEAPRAFLEIRRSQAQSVDVKTESAGQNLQHRYPQVRLRGSVDGDDWVWREPIYSTGRGQYILERLRAWHTEEG